MTTRLIELGTLAAIALLAASSSAQAETISFDLENVWLDPDESIYSSTPHQLGGSFDWTYTPGDFENGVGHFTSMDIPWTPEGLSTLEATIEPQSIEIVYPGSFHNKGVDISIKFVEPFTETSGASIDILLSKFEIQEGVSIAGHFLSGSIEVPCPGPISYGAGSPGTGAIVPSLASSGGLPHLGNVGFGVQCDSLVGGAATYLLLGVQELQAPALGVTILVAPAQATVFQLQATGAQGAPGTGVAMAPLPIPSDPAFLGIEVFLQAVAVDPGAPGGLVSASNGLAVTVCP